MKILIIEDEPSLREIMSRALREDGYVVENASTYTEADSKIAGYTYDCILLDIMLPDGNGLKLLEHLKELQQTRQRDYHLGSRFPRRQDTRARTRRRRLSAETIPYGRTQSSYQKASYAAAVTTGISISFWETSLSTPKVAG